MLLKPRCFDRKCKHYTGVVQTRPGDESSERNVCPAFPEGIPYDIAYGSNPHREVHPEQEDERGTVYSPIK